VIFRLDQLRFGQVVARLRLERISAGTLAVLEQAVVDLALFGIHVALYFRQRHLVLREQHVHVGLGCAHRDFVGAGFERLRGLRRLHLALLVAHERVQVQDWLAHLHRTRAAQVVRVVVKVPAVGLQPSLIGYVTAERIVGGHVRQQAGAALDRIFLAGLGFLDAHPVHRVVAQRGLISLLQRQRMRRDGERQSDGSAEDAALHIQAIGDDSQHQSPPSAAGMRSMIGRKM
jgi:hypothetical protein